MQTVTDFIFLGSKITADGDCSHEKKRCLFLARKAMTNLDSILQSRDITLPTKVRLVKAMVFPVVMYGCESWTIKKTEHYWTVVLENTLESPLDCKKIQPVNPKGNQSWIFTGRTDAEAPILWPPDAKSWLIGKDPDDGKDWGNRRRGWQRMRWYLTITNSTDMNLSNLWEILKDKGAWYAAVHGWQRVGHNWATEQVLYQFLLCKDPPKSQE